VSELNTLIHGIPLTFAEVDNPDQVFGGCNKSFNQLKEEWIDYLVNSDAVKKAAPRIERLHIGSHAHFYFRDSEIPFHCEKHEKTTTLDRCEGCPDWFRPDNVCTADAMGAYIEKQPRSKDMALDTMHVLRVTLKSKT